MNFKTYAITVSLAAAVLSQSGFAHTRAHNQIPSSATLVGSDRLTIAREGEPGDDHRGKGKPLTIAREKEPGDDRGGKDEKEPGDHRRGHKGKPHA